MARTNFPFPAWASHQQIRDVSARIYSQVFESPRTIFLDAEARGQGSWQFFMVPLRPGDVGRMEGFGALSLTCRAQHAAVLEYLGDETIFELKIAPPAGPTLTCSPDPHNIIKNMARLDIWPTPESTTCSRSDWVVLLKMRRDGRVHSCEVRTEILSSNRPFRASQQEMRAERDEVKADVKQELHRIIMNKQFSSARLSRVVTVLDEAKKKMGVLEGGEWWTEELAWLNHVNLAYEDAGLWEVEEESSEEDESDVEMGEGEEQPSGDEETFSGDEDEDEDEEIVEDGSESSEGSEMSIDV